MSDKNLQQANSQKKATKDLKSTNIGKSVPETPQDKDAIKDADIPEKTNKDVNGGETKRYSTVNSLPRDSLLSVDVNKSSLVDAPSSSAQNQNTSVRNTVSSEPTKLSCSDCSKLLSESGFWVRDPRKSGPEQDYFICSNCAIKEKHKAKLPGYVDRSECKPLICLAHKKLCVSLYCETCQIRLCPSCVADHSEHACVDIAQVADSSKQKVQSIMFQNTEDRRNLEAISQMAHGTTQILDCQNLLRTKMEIKNVLRHCFESILKDFDNAINIRESLVAESHLNIRRKVQVIDDEIRNLDAKQSELKVLLDLAPDEVVKTVEAKSRDGSLYRPSIEINMPYLNKESSRTQDIIKDRAKGFMSPKFKEVIDFWLKREMLAPKFDIISVKNSRNIGMNVSVFRTFLRDDRPRMKASKTVLCLENNDGDFDRVELELVLAGDHRSKMVSVDCPDGAIYGLSSFTDGVVVVVEPDRCSTLSGVSNNLWSGTAYLYENLEKEPQVLSVQNCHGFVKKDKRITALCAGKKKLKFAPKLFPPIKCNYNFELQNSTWVAMHEKPYDCVQLVVALFQENVRRREVQKLEIFLLKFNSDNYMRTEIPMRHCQDIDDMAFVEREGKLHLIFCRSVDQSVLKIELKKPSNPSQILSFGEPKLLINPRLKVSEPVINMVFFDNCCFFLTDGGTLLKVRGFFDNLVEIGL
ncbi:uncharacterized protein LOC142349914 [Convolutriloba macropyga]|uniref:uncharacterized protein LOC142349914 n=1 Tax=Convolutriloba macropyga TaxID=536237 RepID=UPI003F51F6DE